jgi:hypothetical protein
MYAVKGRRGAAHKLGGEGTVDLGGPRQCAVLQRRRCAGWSTSAVGVGGDEDGEWMWFGSEGMVSGRRQVSFPF